MQYLDGGLPRHLVLGGDIVSQYNTRWDFSKDFVKPVKETGPDGKPKTSHIGGLYAFQLPEDGTPIERAAMKAHSMRTHATTLPENGDAGNFILNGLPPTNGAPYADPSVTDDGNSSGIRPALSGGGHPNRRGLEQEGLALSAVALYHAVGRCGAYNIQLSSPRTLFHSDRHQ